MTDFGFGFGTPFGGGSGTPVGGNGGANCSAISLARYAAKIQYSDCAFWGIHDPADIHSCKNIWTLAERTIIADALTEAQGEIEQEVGYHLAPCWDTNERHSYASNIQTRWGHVISGGVISDLLVGDSVAVSYLTVPPTVVVTTPCDPASLHVFHEDTDTEITPTSITAVGTTITFHIPLCRLVDEAYWDNPESGWELSDAATWRTPRVDVRCITNSLATQAHLVWRVNDACGLCATAGCSDHQHNGCIYVRMPEIGTVDVRKATYASGVWTASSCACDCYRPDWVELNYYSGLTMLTRQAEDAIVRLAHSKMPSQPCGCDYTARFWSRDRAVPTVYSRERLNCRFGETAGAWFAWQQALAMKLVRGSTL